MSRSNYDKPFYVDVGTSVVAIRCASNHDVIERYDHVWHPHTLELAKDVCDRMNKEAEIGRPLRNCDVGTASQQAQRFAELCTSHSKDGARGICDEKCPFYGKEYGSDCALVWAQMPYERGIEE